MIISILKWILIVFVFLFAFVNSLAIFYDLFFNKKLKPDKNKVWRLQNWKFKEMIKDKDNIGDKDGRGN